MPTRDDFEYALEQTRVLLAPERRIETFGRTQFRFHVITELMDSVHQVRIRSGRVDADRPSIIAPDAISKLLLEGFGEQAREYADQLESDPGRLAFLKYGFVVRKSEVTESIVHDPIEAVAERVLAEVRGAGGPSSAVLQGVDDVWEVALLRFTWDLVRRSAGGNFGELRDRGML
jgi:hypothetical protein